MKFNMVVYASVCDHSGMKWWLMASSLNLSTWTARRLVIFAEMEPPPLKIGIYCCYGKWVNHKQTGTPQEQNITPLSSLFNETQSPAGYLEMHKMKSVLLIAKLTFIWNALFKIKEVIWQNCDAIDSRSGVDEMWNVTAVTDSRWSKSWCDH
jgi:hypothetical protein